MNRNRNSIILRKFHKESKNMRENRWTSKYNVLIGHAKAKDDGEKTKLLFEEKSEVFKNIRLLEIGGALGVHTGPGAISVAIQKIDD